MDIVTGKILKLNNWPDGKVIGVAKRIAAELAEQGLDREVVLARLDEVRNAPGQFLADPHMAELARECIRLNPAPVDESLDELREAPLAYPIWGREAIDEIVLAQMDSAMRLPVTVAGALMPDAHMGYGLPIGGVLAADNAVIPYAVGGGYRLPDAPFGVRSIALPARTEKSGLRKRAQRADGLWHGRRMAGQAAPRTRGAG